MVTESARRVNQASPILAQGSAIR